MSIERVLSYGFVALFSVVVAWPADGPGSPPVAPVKPVYNTYYGTRIEDPYQYMENLKDPEVHDWIKGQAAYTESVLKELPGRASLLARLRELDRSVPRASAVRLPGDVYLIQKRLPTEDVDKLYVRQGLNGSDKLLVDPENVHISAALENKGKKVIQFFSGSLDGKLVAVGIAPGGSERDTEMHIFEIKSGNELPDVIPRAWAGSPSWLADNHSFIYGKLQKLPPGAPQTEVEQKVRAYLHVLGTSDPEKDPAVFGYDAVPSIKVDPTHFAAVSAPPDANYVFGFINTGVSPNNSIYIEPANDLGKSNSSWRKIAGFDDDVADAAVHGDDLYLLTFKNALRYKVIRTDARRPDLANAEEVIPPGQTVVTGINAAQDALYVLLSDGGIARLLRVPYGPHPKPTEVPLPFQGDAAASTDPRLPGALLNLTSWTKAFRIEAYDPTTNSIVDTKIQPQGPFDNPSGLETREVKVTSYDGTQVPLSIIYPKNIKMDGSNPTLLGGYGAYGMAETPYFEPMRLAWFEKGGIFAVCHVRGGGEYGEEWHLAGKGLTKPNTWKDFIACAEYLTKSGYTSPAHLGGRAGSAGGILIGRTITERPDVLAAAIDVVGLSDTLRVETTANGVPNIPEFGSTKTPDGYKALYQMSAYHHVDDKVRYPAVLLETGMNDPRVEPWQAAKMAARLQAATSSGKPILLRVEYEGGHGGIGGTQEQAEQRLADDFSFLLWQFGAPDFQPPH